ncbi:MAG: hypothetical protein ACREEA_07900, partial [Stellaceae bacterium]
VRGLQHELDGVLHGDAHALEAATTMLSTEWAQRSIEQDRIHNTDAAQRMRRTSSALEAAIDALHAEYGKL